MQGGHEGKTDIGRGSPASDSLVEKIKWLKECVTQKYLSVYLVSASPGLLHDLVDVRIGPSVSP